MSKNKTFDQMMWDDKECLQGRDLGNGFDLLVPEWIDPDITGRTVAAIVQGGCASDAYMPAVTNHLALETMNEHGDAIMEYFEWVGADPHSNGWVHDPWMPWSEMAVHFVSFAVEIWAHSTYDALSDEPSPMDGWGGRPTATETTAKE